jgi:hypothetical protein
VIAAGVWSARARVWIAKAAKRYERRESESANRPENDDAKRYERRESESANRPENDDAKRYEGRESESANHPENDDAKAKARTVQKMTTRKPICEDARRAR